LDTLLAAAVANLTSPMVLCFGLGVVAGAARSDLELPEPIARGLSIYLMLAIGLKGGAGLAEAPALAPVIPALVVAVVSSLLMPVLAWVLLRRVFAVADPTAAAVAAHYGSVSVVTFAAATGFLGARGIPFEQHLVAMLALMETPAILTGLGLAGAARREAGRRRELLRELLVNGSVVLLLGGLVVGFLSGPRGLADVKPFFVDPFRGALCLFLLDMGLLVSRRMRRGVLGPRLVAFGLLMPVVGAAWGLVAARALGLSVGGGTLLGVLCASASYIAVPAAMRLALPKADPAVYVTLALGVTFPLNVTVGIPLVHAAAAAFLGAP
jgi:hypothetical protein